LPSTTAISTKPACAIKIASAEARVFAKANGKLLAHGTSTMMVLPQQVAG